MALRSIYAPMLPEMDPFLFAAVGDEETGIPLSVQSVLARLGLDPRNEAVRLSHLTSRAAASQLGRLLARLPDRPWTPSEIRRIASKLVELLPAAPNSGNDPQAVSAPNRKLSYTLPRLILLALAGALAVGMVAHNYATSDLHRAVAPASETLSAAPSVPMR